MHEIKIYGEIIPTQYAMYADCGYSNLATVQELLKGANGGDVLVRINCIGGDVDEGFAIYSELRRYAKQNNSSITTLAEGRCASIATVFFLAGDERIVTENTDNFVHNAWAYAVGDASTLVRVADNLENCNDKIAKHYALHTDLTYEQARELMNNETSLTPEEAIQIRFATKIEEVLRPKALARINFNKINKNNTNININKQEMNKIKKQSGIKAMLMNLYKSFSNKIVFDAANNEVDFYELSDEDVIKVGDMATIGGEPADGDVTMPDGSVYVFSEGALEEIRTESNEIDDLIARIEELEEAALASASITTKAINSIKKELEEAKIKQTTIDNRLNRITNLEKKIGIETKDRDQKNTTEIQKKNSVLDAKELRMKIQNQKK